MNKVLMIGLDGATFSLIKPLIEDGIMPFLKEFLTQGVHGDLMSTLNPLTPPAWISMITGRSPDVHGVYDFTRPEFSDSNVFLKVYDSRDIRCETVWSMASRQERRITSLNFYGMSPTFPVEGYMVSGFVSWKHLRSATYPPTLLDTLKNLPGFNYKSLSSDLSEEKKYVQSEGVEEKYEDWIKWQFERTQAWADLLCHLMKTDPTELTSIVFDGPDKLQHFCWRYLDPQFSEIYSSPQDVYFRQLCLDYYRQLDNTIKHIVSLAAPETNVIMTSDHGFGPTTEVVYLNEWLARNDYLHWANETEINSVGKLYPDQRQPKLIDWKSTLLFCPTPSSNAIFLNKANPSVKNLKNEDYVKLCTKLRQQLLDYRNPDDGEQIFVRVDFNESKMQGRTALEYSPDLTVQLRDGGFVSVLRSAKVVIPRKKPEGTHRPNGIFIARGPDIKAGVQIQPLSILDITPLLLYFLGLPIPTDLEGRVPTEILKENALKEHAVEYQDFAKSFYDETQKHQDEISEEEKESLMAQLKLLGYME